MKKFTTLLISGSLTLAAAAFAQQTGTEDQQQSTTEHKAHADKAHADATQSPTGTETKGGGGREERRAARKASRQENAGTNANANTNATNESANGTKANANTETGAAGSKAARRGKKSRENAANANADTNANAAGAGTSTETGANANANANVGKGGKGKHGRNAPNENNAATANSSPSSSVAPTASAAPSAAAAVTNTNTNATANQTNVNAAANVNANTNVAAGGGRVRGHGKGGKQLDQNVVSKVKTQNASFRAQPRPDKVPTVTFTQGHHVEGAERWQGAQYNVFREYHAERHDQNWYHQRYTRVELIGGGYYYWNNGYWFPAWGYDTGHEYYAYDAPIYVGHAAEPPDKVIADVQAMLQDAGYYTGEVDGLLGPLTRQALADYQADNGLYQTAVIDEPTLDSLGLA